MAVPSVQQWPFPPAADVQSLSLWCRQMGDLLTLRLRDSSETTGNIPTLQDFGAAGDGVTDDYAAIQAALDFASENGVLIYAPPGTYLLSGHVLISSPTTAFGLVGAGPDLTVFRKTSPTVASILEVRDGDGVLFEDFTVDGQFSSLATGNHGIVIRNTHNAFVRRVRAVDYASVGILAFTTDGVNPIFDTYTNVVFEDCETDGLGVGANGLQITDYLDSGMRGCVAKGVLGSPGLALQLKNKCVRCFIHDSQAEGSVAGVGFGSEVVDTATLCRVSDITIIGCNTGIRTGPSVNNHFSDILIDMAGAASDLDAIDIQNDSDNNVFQGITAVNVAASRAAVRFRDTALNNRVQFNFIDKASGNLVVLDTNAANNDVHIDKTADNFSQIDDKVLDNSGNVTNLVTYRDNLHSGTVQATTSGTAFDFIIPTWARRVTVLFDQVSLSGTDNLLVQIGDSGGVETTGYNAGSNAVTANDGFIVEVANAARLTMGIMTICDTGDNVWVASHAVGATAGGGFTATGGGRKQLSATLDRVRITRTGADTFDIGRVNILFE